MDWSTNENKVNPYLVSSALSFIERGSYGSIMIKNQRDIFKSKVRTIQNIQWFWVLLLDMSSSLPLEVRVLFTERMARTEPVFRGLICEGGRRELAVLHDKALAGGAGDLCK